MCLDKDMVLLDTYAAPEGDTDRPIASPKMDSLKGANSCGGPSVTPATGSLVPPVLSKRCALKVTCCLKKNREAKLERALLQSLQKARSQFRLRLGLCQSLRILELEPASVVICILPVDDDDKDSLSHVQLLLIEAYCHEHAIRMLKVHSPEHIWKIVKYNNETDIEDEEGGSDDEHEDDPDDSIVLILRTHTGNPADDELLALYDEEYSRGNSSPEITSHPDQVWL